MTFLFVPRKGDPAVAAGWVAKVGSANERPGITGISHLFEHMMFNGSAKYGPKEFDRQLESRGGYSNAYTSNDMTAYYEDFDLSWRGRRRGWRYGYAPASVVHHRHAAGLGVGSERFRYLVGRNRLLALTKLAPARMAARAWE